jgi:hypothetical protein
MAGEIQYRAALKWHEEWEIERKKKKYDWNESAGPKLQGSV